MTWGLPAAVVAACVGYLIYSASGASAEYYVTVSELRANTPSGDVRVAGVVQDDVQRTQGGLHVTFTEKDGTASEISYEDSSGNRTVFRFSGWRKGKPRAESDYRVTGPPGTRVLEN